MKAQLQQRNNIDINAWDALAAESPQGSIFVKSWYLDAVTPGWSGICVYDNEKLQAIFPLWIRKKYFARYALQPTFTRYWGVCLANRSFNNFYDEISWKKKITEAIVSAIPAGLSAVQFNFHPAFDYPLPFFHKKFELLQRFTYLLDLDTAQEVIEKAFSKSVRKKINKAAGNEIIIYKDNTISHLLTLFTKYEAQGKPILAQQLFSVFERLFTVCNKENNCFVLTAKNASAEVIASAIFLVDEKCTYFLSGLVDPAHKQSAAMPLIVTTAIKEAKNLGSHSFDFLGSMTESIETFFRSFGGKPVPFTVIDKKIFPFSLFR